MNYESLSEEVRSKLEGSKRGAARYSSLVGEAGVVDDAILLAKDSAIDVEAVMPGYVDSPVKVWFEYVTSGKEDEEALRMAEEACADIAEEIVEPADDVPSGEIA